MRVRHAERIRMLQRVFRRLRVNEPWRYKAPFLMSVPYFMLFAASASFGTSLITILCSLCTIAGIGGFAYLSNDVFDRTADRTAGRSNGTAHLSTWRTAQAFAAFLGAALAPWIVYFLDVVSLCLLVAEFVLLLAYSVPPLRLKQRGILGVIADALYAHVVPALLAAYTFYVVTGRTYGRFLAFVATLGTWQLFVGLRSAVTHQLADAEHDRAARTSTYVIRRGEQASMRLITFVLAPLELTAWAAFTAVAAATMPLLGAGWLVYAAVTVLIIKVHLRQPAREPLCDRLDRLLNEYYLRWMPLVVLMALCIRDPRMVAFLLLHLLIFRNGLTPLLSQAWYAVRPAGGASARGVVATE